MSLPGMDCSSIQNTAPNYSNNTSSNSDAPDINIFETLAGKYESNRFALVILNAVQKNADVNAAPEGKQSEGGADAALESAKSLDLGIKSSWNSVTLFFSRLVSWIKDGASNKLIKAEFIKYVESKLTNDEKYNAVRESLKQLVNPTSRGALDLRTVHQIVNGVSEAAGQLQAPEVSSDQPQVQVENLVQPSDSEANLNSDSNEEGFVLKPVQGAVRYATPQLSTTQKKSIQFSSAQLPSHKSDTLDSAGDGDSNGFLTPKKKKNNKELLQSPPILLTPRYNVNDTWGNFEGRALTLLASQVRARLELSEEQNILISDITEDDVLKVANSNAAEELLRYGLDNKLFEDGVVGFMNALAGMVGSHQFGQPDFDEDDIDIDSQNVDGASDQSSVSSIEPNGNDPLAEQVEVQPVAPQTTVAEKVRSYFTTAIHGAASSVNAKQGLPPGTPVKKQNITQQDIVNSLPEEALKVTDIKGKAINYNAMAASFLRNSDINDITSTFKFTGKYILDTAATNENPEIKLQDQSLMSPSKDRAGV